MEKQIIDSGNKIFTAVRLSVVVACLLVQATGCIKPVDTDEPQEELPAEAPEMDARLIAIVVDGNDYTSADPPVQLVTGQVFFFSVTMQNTGTATWGQHRDQGERGASFMSRNPDLNTDFGVFFISPGQSQRTATGETFVYHTSLHAPSEPGEYTMTWLLADWIIPYGHTYTTSPLFGDTVTVKVTVVQRTEQPPPTTPRKPGVLDGFDFEYVGSFTLPPVPDAVPWDDKKFFRSGITMRTVGGEKRLLMGTGVYAQSLYEVAIPPAPVKIINGDYSDVPVAELRNLFGSLTKHADADKNGTMWYDEETGLFYWTNAHSYYFTYPPTFPVLRAARLDGGVLTEVRQWLFPASASTHYKSFWGGVTAIPESFAEQYTGGRRLALGFGGSISIIQTASNGPALAAIKPDFDSGEINFQNIIYYPFPEGCIRDGNYFYAASQTNYLNPVSPGKEHGRTATGLEAACSLTCPTKKDMSHLPLRQRDASDTTTAATTGTAPIKMSCISTILKRWDRRRQA